MSKWTDLAAAIKGIFKPKNRGHELTDEDRQKGKEILQLNAKINLLERQLIQQKRLEKLEAAIIGGTKENDIETAFINQVLPMLLAGKSNISVSENSHAAATNAPQKIPASSNLSEDDLKKIADKLRPYAAAYKQQIAALSDEEIIFIKNELIK